MSCEVLMFCQIGAGDIGVIGDRVCSSVASQFEGAVCSDVSASTDLNAYRIETTSGQELDIQFYWSGMFFEHSIAMASREPDAGVAPDSAQDDRLAEAQMRSQIARSELPRVVSLARVRRFRRCGRARTRYQLDGGYPS